MPTARPDRFNLLDFFRVLSNTQFVIPVYQRNYIWEAKKEVKKFLEDYKSLLDGTRTKHFIGIIMYLQIERSIGFRECSIVDGQQRIVTTFLMFYALKALAIETNDLSFSSMVNNQYLVNEYVENERDRLKLKPMISDDNVFEKIINDNFSSITREEKKSRVYKNYIYIKEFLKENYGRYSLRELLNVLNKFYFVAIPLNSETDDAQKIFETINSAGAALSKSDLIRNYILMNIESSRQEYLYKHYWFPLEKKFEQSGKIENFFRLFLANKTYSLCNLEDIYEEFQKWYKKFLVDGTDEQALKLINAYANYYIDLFFNDNPDIDSVVKDAIKEFKKSSIEPTAPLLMEIYHLNKTKDDFDRPLVSANDFAKVINLFNTYNIRRNICNHRTGILTRLVPLMLKSVKESCSGNYRDIYKHCVSYLVDNQKGKQSFMPDDEYLKTNLINANAYALKNYVKVIFEKIELHNNSCPVDFSNLSIEHLMPQTPTEYWLNELNVSKEVYEYNLHRLGNLTLASVHDNSVMSNNSFEFKREVLSGTGHLLMNMEIIEKPSWGIQDIESRTASLIDKICELYPYVTNGSDNVKKYPIYLNTNSCLISAFIFQDRTVEIQEGSEFSALYTSLIQRLIENDILRDCGEKYVFLSNYSFESLEDATDFFVKDNSINVWELWIDTNEDPLNLDVRVKLENS